MIKPFSLAQAHEPRHPVRQCRRPLTGIILSAALGFGCGSPSSTGGSNGSPAGFGERPTSSWTESLGMGPEAPVIAILPSSVRSINDGFQMKADQGALFVGSQAQKGMELRYEFAVHRFAQGAWSRVAHAEHEWGESVEGFALRNGVPHWLLVSHTSKTAQLMRAGSSGEAVAVGPVLALSGITGTASGSVDLEFDSDGDLYFGYFEGATNGHAYRLYSLRSGAWTELTPTIASIGVGIRQPRSPTRGFVLQGRKLLLAGLNLRFSDEPTVLEYSKDSGAWRRALGYPRLMSDRRPEFFSLDANPSSQAFTVLSRWPQQPQLMDSFISYATGSWSPLSRLRRDDPSPFLRLMRTFAFPLGALNVLNYVSGETEKTVVVWQSGSSSRVYYGPFAFGAPLGRSQAVAVFGDRIVLAHFKPGVGRVVSDLGPRDPSRGGRESGN